jgi:hypothetical protein
MEQYAPLGGGLFNRPFLIIRSICKNREIVNGYDRSGSAEIVVNGPVLCRGAMRENAGDRGA